MFKIYNWVVKPLVEGVFGSLARSTFKAGGMSGKAKADHGVSVKAGGVSMEAGQDVLVDKVAVISVSLTAGGVS